MIGLIRRLSLRPSKRGSTYGAYFKLFKFSEYAHVKDGQIL